MSKSTFLGSFIIVELILLELLILIFNALNINIVSSNKLFIVVFIGLYLALNFVFKGVILVLSFILTLFVLELYCLLFTSIGCTIKYVFKKDKNAFKELKGYITDLKQVSVGFKKSEGWKLMPNLSEFKHMCGYINIMDE